MRPLKKDEPMRRWPTLAALLSLGVAMPALAQSSTYDVLQRVGAGSVSGTLTTDGTTGVLTASNIPTFQLNLNGNNATATLTGGTNGNARVVVAGRDLVASGGAITFNYDGAAGSYVLFQSNLFSGSTYWCNSHGTTACLAGATIAPQYYTDPSATRAPDLAGIQTLATRNGSPTPTPTPTPTPRPTDPSPSPTGPTVTLADLIAFIDSIGNLSNTRFGTMLDTNLADQILLGLNEQVSCGGCGSGGAIIGSAEATAHGRIPLDPSLTLFGGGRIGQMDHRGSRSPLDGGLAVSLQYDPAGMGRTRPFASIFVAGSYSQMVFDRGYAGPSSGASSGRGRTDAWGLNAGVSAGYVARLSKKTELAATVGYARQWQFVGGYAEPGGATNPFAATFAKGSDRTDTIRMGIQASQLVSRRIEATLIGGANYVFDARAGARAMVAGLAVTPTRPNFVYYQGGGRIGIRVAPGFTVDLFLDQVFAPSSIGSAAHGGATVRIAL